MPLTPYFFCDDLRRTSESLVELGDLRSTGLCKVGPPSAPSADDPGELADELTGVDAVDHVVGDGREDRCLAAALHAEDHNP
jgi:hypothetical protein